MHSWPWTSATILWARCHGERVSSAAPSTSHLRPYEAPIRRRSGQLLPTGKPKSRREGPSQERPSDGSELSCPRTGRRHKSDHGSCWIQLPPHPQVDQVSLAPNLDQMDNQSISNNRVGHARLVMVSPIMMPVKLPIRRHAGQEKDRRNEPSVRSQKIDLELLPWRDLYAQ